MGELLLCKESIAAMPYYIEGISLNVYSMEELCYFIQNNTYLIERDFMNEDLCTWVGKEVKLPILAEKMRELVQRKGRLSDFVLLILESCYYCTREEMRTIITIIREMEGKSDFECNKIRADRLMEKEKYLSSIYEYKRLLDSEDAQKENPMLIGNIWHNLGVAYARLFLFEEAANCFKKAYQKNNKFESLKECLFAYRCLHDEGRFMSLAIEQGLTDEDMQKLREELSNASRGENTTAFEEHIEALALINERGDKQQFQREVDQIVQGWKEEYRRMSRV